MSMADLIEPAIERAHTGHRLSELQIYWSNKYLDDILSSDYLSFMMLEDGRRIGAPGTVYCRPDLARTLRRIVEEGVESFYRGGLAAEIAADMAANGGFVQRSDLASVRVQERPPLSTRYRGLKVVTAPAPAGGPILVDILETLDRFPSSLLAGNTVERHHVLIESFRLARAGAASSSADLPGSVRGSGWIRPVITPGLMIEKEKLAPALDPDCTGGAGESTTHIAVVDRWGNVVSTTSTLGRSFGACVATPGLGFPYNGFLESFDYSRPHCPDYLRPYAPCPTDMAPTIVIADGMPKIALGSPGSNRIASILADVIVNVVDRGMGLEEALEAPRIVWGGENAVNQVHIEVREPMTEELVAGLEAIGFNDILRIEFPEMDKYVVLVGGVNAVAWDERASTFVGVGDRRRTGFAGGPRVAASR
jgi:gamma-glutamyltranspeptidase/glutathione hydrolase